MVANRMEVGDQTNQNPILGVQGYAFQMDIVCSHADDQILVQFTHLDQHVDCNVEDK